MISGGWSFGTDSVLSSGQVSGFWSGAGYIVDYTDVSSVGGPYTMYGTTRADTTDVGARYQCTQEVTGGCAAARVYYNPSYGGGQSWHRISVHELGHAASLEHCDECGSVMEEISPPSDFFSSDEIAAINARY